MTLTKADLTEKLLAETGLDKRGRLGRGTNPSILERRALCWGSLHHPNLRGPRFFVFLINEVKAI
jgi:hypothetical protein